MPALPTVDEVGHYITQRLQIAGSTKPNIFTLGAIDFIFQCSEGIPRQINNLCDNAMIAAYAANEQTIGRAIIEEVAENLDLLPDKDKLLASDRAAEVVGSARVLTPQGQEELLGENKGVVQNSAIKDIHLASESNGREEAQSFEK
jgi:general secretion pathway protein A